MMTPLSLRSFGLVLTLILFGPSTAPAEEPDPKDYAISLELKHEFDPPGPAALRDLARQRYEAAAAEFAEHWDNFLAGRGTYVFLVQSSVRLMEAQAGVNRQPEAQFDALEGHLQRMLLAFQFVKALSEHGRVAYSDLVLPFSWAIADAKFRLANAIFDQWSGSSPSDDEMERLWIELGCRDSAHACRVRWEIQSAGVVAFWFLDRHLPKTSPQAPSPDRIIVSDSLGEICVLRSSHEAESERDEENAARHRRWDRAWDLLTEMMLEQCTQSAP